MLRRKPTAIAITTEDLAAFEDKRLAKQNNTTSAAATGQQHAQPGSSGAGATIVDPSDELKPLPGDKARIVRSREERIGIGRRG
ncbi:hypothetical protein PHISP_03132 [Aspergillus sp. HF37]|nr:hypothetical protein PHISP_03132 [Aspergillus sp. HF37]